MDHLAFDPPTGVLEKLAPDVRRLLAPNPSPMTYRGTNTYIVGTGRVALIDPGPALQVHLEAILNGLHNGESISHIFVTHSHVDHSPLAKEVSQRTGAPIYAYGDSRAGRSAIMTQLAQSGVTGGGEGLDPDFRPDYALQDGETISGDTWQLTALWTPGHFCNHMCFSDGNALFSGDLVMGWASTMVSPPDGDLSAFMASLEQLLLRPEAVYYPGHGASVENAQTRVKWLLDHRKAREAEIRTILQKSAATIPELTKIIYSEVNPGLMPAAQRNVFAHLIDLEQRKVVTASPKLEVNARFHII